MSNPWSYKIDYDREIAADQDLIDKLGRLANLDIYCPDSWQTKGIPGIPIKLALDEPGFAERFGLTQEDLAAFAVIEGVCDYPTKLCGSHLPAGSVQRYDAFAKGTEWKNSAFTPIDITDADVTVHGVAVDVMRRLAASRGRRSERKTARTRAQQEPAAERQEGTSTR